MGILSRPLMTNVTFRKEVKIENINLRVTDWMRKTKE